VLLEIVEIPRERLKGVDVTVRSHEFRSEQSEKPDVRADVENDGSGVDFLTKQALVMPLVGAEPAAMWGGSGDPTPAAQLSRTDADDGIPRHETEWQPDGAGDPLTET
jgi:hypothetical protein